MIRPSASLLVLGSVLLGGCSGDSFQAVTGTQGARKRDGASAGGSGDGNDAGRSNGGGGMSGAGGEGTSEAGVGGQGASGAGGQGGASGTGGQGSSRDAGHVVTRDGATDAGSGTAGDAASDASIDAPVVDASCSAPSTWYPDGDHDRVGRTSGAVQSCESPGDHFVKKGGDCNDDNALVYPGQTEYFEEPYVGSGGGETFDYDCSGKEEGSDDQLGAAPNCGGLALSNCSGQGYVPTDRTGTGQNKLCGSAVVRTCQPAGGLNPFCTSVEEDASPKRCH